MDNSGLKTIERKSREGDYRTPVSGAAKMKYMMPDQNMAYNQEQMRSNNNSEFKRRGYGRHDSNPTALKNISYQRQALVKQRSQMNNASPEMLIINERRPGGYAVYSGGIPDHLRNDKDV